MKVDTVCYYDKNKVKSKEGSYDKFKCRSWNFKKFYLTHETE